MSLVGLSIPQPGPWAILRAGCRVVNLPLGAAPPKHRGEVLLHASASANLDAFDEANRRMLRAGVLPSGVSLPWSADLPRGGFVARATMVEVLHVDRCVRNPWLDPEEHTLAILLADVHVLPAFVPAPAPTTPGLPFMVDGDTFARALAMAEQATTAAEEAAVAEVWRTARRVGRGPRSKRLDGNGIAAVPGQQSLPVARA